MNINRGRVFGGAARYGVVGMATVVVGYPVLWMVLQSFKTKFELYSNIWGLPQQLFVDNYVQAWRIARMGTYILNSVIVSVSTVALVLVVASLAGYAFARLRFRGREVLFYTFVFTLIVPVQVTIIPLYAVVSGLGLSNTYFALILPYAAAGLPLSIFLL